jgi:hypothetical protein
LRVMSCHCVVPPFLKIRGDNSPDIGGKRRE